MYQLSGTVKTVGETKQITDTFKKREFVVSTEDQYPQHVLLQLVQDKCNLADPLRIGEKVTVNFDVQGREWRSPQGEIKYFVSLNAWKITQEPIGGGEMPQGSIPPPPPPPMPSNDDADDLPF